MWAVHRSRIPCLPCPAPLSEPTAGRPVRDPWFGRAPDPQSGAGEGLLGGIISSRFQSSLSLLHTVGFQYSSRRTEPKSAPSGKTLTGSSPAAAYRSQADISATG